MAWTEPQTILEGRSVSSRRWNEQAVNNLIAIKTPQSYVFTFNQATNYTTTSTSFVAVDSTNLSFTFTPYPIQKSVSGMNVTRVLIGFTGCTTGTNTFAHTFFDVSMDGVQLGGDDGIIRHATNANTFAPHFLFLKENVPSTEKTFTLLWKVNTGKSTLYAGAGTSNRDVHGQFFVREVS